MRGLVSTDPNCDTDVAYHEAGHAVVGFILGLSLSEVTIETRNKAPHVLLARGAGAFEDFPEEDHPDLDCQFSLGGFVAQVLWDSLRKEGSNHDIEALSKYDLEHVCGLKQDKLASGADAEEWAKQMRDKTEGILIREWNAVEAVATALLARRTLSATKIRHVIEEFRWNRGIVWRI